ncbi:MAG TPA: sensor histidine kinase [Candidatus Limnocylindrales bacterium]|nr:sensor histidine kinase [Candidatus Limnocylindrales bacterium]
MAIAAATLVMPRSDPAQWPFDPLVRWPWWPGAPSEALVLFAASLFALGVAAFLRFARSGIAQALLAGSAANVAAIWLSAHVRPDQLAYASASWAAFIGAGFLTLVMWSSLVHLVLVFPLTGQRRRGGLWWVVPIYVVPQLVLLIGVGFSGALAPRSLDWLDAWPRVHAAIVSLLLVVAIAGILIRLMAVSVSKRREVGAVAVAVVLAAGAALLLIDVPIMLGLAPLVPRSVVVLVGLPIPVLLTLALWRDRGFRIDRLRRSRLAMLHAREEERRRLRRDLHDGLGPTLAAIGLKVDAAASWLHTDAKAAERLLGEVRTDLTGALAETRRLVRGLRPPALDSEGLAGAIRTAAAEFATGMDDAPTIWVSGEELPTLPAAVEVAAYRIVHECLTNMVRHSRARHCEVRLQVRDGSLWIEVRDDGIGYAADMRPGVGTEAMRERVDELDGQLSAMSVPGGGTKVEAMLPIVLG